MRIAVDLLSLGYGGSETYPREILPRLAQSEHEFTVLLCSRAGTALRDVLPSNVKVVDAPRATRNPFLRLLYQQRALPHWLNENWFDVLFVPGGQTGTRRRRGDSFKLVTVLRNMLPFAPKQRATYRATRYPYYRLKLWLKSKGLLSTFSASDRVVFISEYSERTVGPQLPGKARVVIPHGVGRAFREANPCSSEELAALGIEAPFLLYLSIIDPYKHQMEVIEGFQRYMETRRSEEPLRLVLAGPIWGAYGRQVTRAVASTNGRVQCLGAVPRSGLAALLRSAEALVFASTCETCPNILLEYLAAARPILCSHTPPMPEFAGDAAYYVEAESPISWTNAFADLLSSPKLMRQLAARSKARADIYTWERTAKGILKVLTEWGEESQRIAAAA